MKVVYCAGAYRAANRWKIEGNIMRAAIVGESVISAGMSPVLPHTMLSCYDGAFNDQVFLDITIELMRRCDAVLLVPGWEGSEGTGGEIKEAERLGIPVFNDIDSLCQYFKNV